MKNKMRRIECNKFKLRNKNILLAAHAFESNIKRRYDIIDSIKNYEC